ALLWRPRLAPLLIGAALPFYFFSRSLGGYVAVSPPGLILLLAWPATLVRAASAHRPLRLPRSSYDGPLALFMVAALLSLLVSEYPLLSARALRAVVIEPILFFWLLRVAPSAPRLAVLGAVAAATVTALAAIGQIGLGVGGTEAEGVRRAQAWYPSPNHLALLLGRVWPFLLAAALEGRGLAWPPALLTAVALLLTFSIGGWLGAAAAAVATLAVLRRRRAATTLAITLAISLAVVSALAVVGVLPERLNPLRQTGGFRVDLWLSAVAMVRDHPLLGVGLDNFAYLYQQDYLREGAIAEPNLSHPHNWLLNIWLELGLAGLVAFVALVAIFFGRALRQRGWLAAGAVGAMTDLLVHGLIDNSYFLVDLAFLFWLILTVVDDASARIESE
ncbi:MAG: O-antigen ligase family protein, partial [Chloroflexota bacterium]|nr:O-antigen ligase family protein [Chloroflexota bacterium]